MLSLVTKIMLLPATFFGKNSGIPELLFLIMFSVMAWVVLFSIVVGFIVGRMI